MSRSSSSELVKRVNFAIGLLAEGKQRSEAKKELMERFDISQRQAFRYLKTAQRHSTALQIPEEKTVLTVKVPISLIYRLRKQAKKMNRSLSSLIIELLGNN
jgi:DNA gyrase/topoisomerase IV subunit A